MYSEKDTNVTGYRPNTQQLATIQESKTVPVKMFLLSNCCMYKVFSYCLSYVLCETLPFSLFLFFFVQIDHQCTCLFLSTVTENLF